MEGMMLMVFQYRPLDSPHLCTAERHAEYQSIDAQYAAMLCQPQGETVLVRDLWLVCGECAGMLQKGVTLDGYIQEAT